MYSLRSPSLWILQGLIGLNFHTASLCCTSSAKGHERVSRSPSAPTRSTRFFLPSLSWITPRVALQGGPQAHRPQLSLQGSPASHEQEAWPSLGHTKPRVPPQPFLRLCRPSERISSARAAVGVRKDGEFLASAQEEPQAPQPCSLSKAATPEGSRIGVVAPRRHGSRG